MIPHPNAGAASGEFDRVPEANDAFLELVGYSREELIGTPFSDYFQDAERATAGVKETFEKGVVTDYVLTLARRSGTPLRVSFNASVFKDASGDVRGIFASARDITEQSRLQSQLGEERTYNRGLIEASLDGLITVDPVLGEILVMSPQGSRHMTAIHASAEETGFPPRRSARTGASSVAIFSSNPTSKGSRCRRVS